MGKLRPREALLGPARTGGKWGTGPRVDSLSVSLRLATQWSVEGEEGAARGQRQQERAWQLRAQDEGEGGQSPEQLEQEKL